MSDVGVFEDFSYANFCLCHSISVSPVVHTRSNHAVGVGVICYIRCLHAGISLD